MFDGQLLMTGACVSVTITSNEHVDELPAASVAVYVTVVVPIGKLSPVLKSEVNCGLHASVAVGAVHVTGVWQAVACTVMFDGQLLMTGACVSFTITSNEHVDELPVSSVAVYVTVVVPMGKLSPELKSEVN
jgi:hypothetical protein